MFIRTQSAIPRRRVQVEELASGTEGELVSDTDYMDDDDYDCADTAYGYCCSLCNAQAGLAHREEELLALPSLGYFLALVREYRKPSDALRLTRERERRIESGEHPGNRILVCQRCGQEYDSWDARPYWFCTPCRDERWRLDEDGCKTAAYGGKLPESVARQVASEREQHAQREREREQRES